MAIPISELERLSKLSIYSLAIRQTNRKQICLMPAWASNEMLTAD